MVGIKIFTYLPEEAKEIREEVFMREQGFHNEFDEIDDFAIHIVIYNDGSHAATCRLFQENVRHVAGRFAVRKKYRRHGLGRRLLLAAETKAASEGGKELWLGAQRRVALFYEKAGYMASGEIYFDEGCPHIWMSKKIK